MEGCPPRAAASRGGLSASVERRFRPGRKPGRGLRPRVKSHFVRLTRSRTAWEFENSHFASAKPRFLRAGQKPRSRYLFQRELGKKREVKGYDL